MSILATICAFATLITLIGLVIKWVFWPGAHEGEPKSSNFLWRILNTPLPQRMEVSWPMNVLLIGFIAFALWSQYQKNPRIAGHYLLVVGLMGIIIGIASFSKRERNRTKMELLSLCPDAASQIAKPEFEGKYRKRGYFILAFGILAFLLWTQLYGLSSLSTI